MTGAKTCDHCGAPRGSGSGSAVRLPGGIVFRICTACHQRLVAAFPTYTELTDMLLAAHNLRTLTP